MPFCGTMVAEASAAADPASTAADAMAARRRMAGRSAMRVATWIP
jgi:hypothetical protein